MIPNNLSQLDPGFHAVPPDHLAAVVTILEMEAHETAAPPARSDVLIEEITNPQAEWYRTLFRKVGAPWLWSSRLQWSDSELQEKLSAPTTRLFVAKLVNGEEIGYVELNFFAKDQCEIAFLGVVNEWARRGVGRWLLENGMYNATKAGASRLMIHTCTLDDQRALALYIKCGFRPVRRAVEILADPRKKGLLPLDVSTHPLF
ncbi:MAG: GNAT family N-acetyltransferase [Pseudomonadota bacterium]